MRGASRNYCDDKTVAATSDAQLKHASLSVFVMLLICTELMHDADSESPHIMRRSAEGQIAARLIEFSARAD